MCKDFLETQRGGGARLTIISKQNDNVTALTGARGQMPSKIPR